MSVFLLKMKAKEILHKPGFYMILMVILGLLYEKTIWGMFLLVPVLYIMTVINRYTNLKEQKAKMELFDPETPKYLDALIEECFTTYLVFHPDLTKEDTHIKEEEENEIRREVVESFLKGLGKPMILKLRAYYNEDYMEEKVMEKIFMYITNYVAGINTIKDDGTTLKLMSDQKKIVDFI